MTDCVNNISDHVISSLIPKIGIRYVTGADTAVLTPFVNSGNPMSCTSISCLMPYQDIPFPARTAGSTARSTMSLPENA